MNITKVAKVFGTVLLLVGVLGFVPGLTPHGHLLGLFHIDALHNLIHLAGGGAALLAGITSNRASKLYFQIFGVIYGLVAILGFIYMTDDILGLIANNMADNLLHVLITGAALLLGFSSDKKQKSDNK